MIRLGRSSRWIMRVFYDLFLALVALTLLAMGHAHAAGPWFVAVSGSDANDCLSATTPCATINGALTKPGFAAGDAVRVELGTYTGTGLEVVLLDTDATLSGGWDAAFATQAGSSTLDGENARRGITVESNVVATVERFTVENGLAFGQGGAGILSDSGTLTLDDCVIRDNDGGFGIGIRNVRGVLTLNRTIVSNHLSEDAISNFFGTAVLNDSTVSGNGGSGVANSGSVTLNSTTVSGNMAFGIDNDGGSVELKDSTVESNTRGILNFTGSTLVNSSTIRANANGGIANLSGNGLIGSVTLINSTVSGNGNAASSSLMGGGVSNSGALIAINSTITANTATDGGGIFHQFNPGFSSVMLSNSIVAGNSVAGFGGSDCATSGSAEITSLGHNLIGTLDSCSVVLAAEDLTNVDPLLGPLQNNGGPTDTHALRPGSPAIDMGNNGVCTGPDVNSIDQRGVERPDGDATSGGRCDIGAVEFVAAAPLVIPIFSLWMLVGLVGLLAWLGGRQIRKAAPMHRGHRP